LFPFPCASPNFVSYRPFSISQTEINPSSEPDTTFSKAVLYNANATGAS
jgi:hypothetical protein